MNNLFTITDYPGLDPESTQVGNTDSFNNTNDDGAYPISKTLTIGFKLNF